MKRAYIFLAEGFEDIEALATCDILRRAGMEVILTGINDEPFALSSHGITVAVDCSLEECISEFSTEDVMVFPGGMPGSKNLAACSELIAAMKRHHSAGGHVAAICAAPGLVLSQLDDLDGCHFTCYDGFAASLEAKGAVFEPKPAVVSGNVITGRGPGHTKAFALAIVSAMMGKEVADNVRAGMDLICE